MTAARRSAALLASVLVGVGAAKLLDISDADKSPAYGMFVTALLGFGLYASARGIEIAEFRSRLRTVVLAVTLGVLAKALMIFGVMYLVFGRSDYLILGVAVAQIDPLSVAAVRAKSRMSESGKALLAAWASFDDPITVLLTAYFTAFALHARDGAAAGGEAVGQGLLAFGENLLWNLLLAGAVYLAWRTARRVSRRRASQGVLHSRFAKVAVRGFLLLAVLVVGVLAVRFSLLLALAIIGLFFRPEVGRGLDRMTEAAMILATFAVGLVLVGGVRLAEGVVLGVAAYAAQIVTALVLTLPRAWRADRARLALGQQNGLTAIILALLLEPDFPGAIAIVAPAIVVVNLLHALCNGVWDRLHPPAAETVSEPAAEKPEQPEQSGRSAFVTGLNSRWRARPAGPPAERAG